MQSEQFRESRRLQFRWREFSVHHTIFVVVVVVLVCEEHWKSGIRRQFTLSLTKKAFPCNADQTKNTLKNHNTDIGVKHLLSYRIFERQDIYVYWMDDSHYLNDFWCQIWLRSAKTQKRRKKRVCIILSVRGAQSQPQRGSKRENLSAIQSSDAPLSGVRGVK